MQRPKPATEGGPLGGGVPGKGDIFPHLPRLWELLTDDAWDDGTARERSTVLILCDGPVAKVWLNDRATGRTAWASGETVEQALRNLEEQLATGAVPWRTMDGKRQKKF